VDLSGRDHRLDNRNIHKILVVREAPMSAHVQAGAESDRTFRGRFENEPALGISAHDELPRAVRCARFNAGREDRWLVSGFACRSSAQLTVVLSYPGFLQRRLIVMLNLGSGKTCSITSSSPSTSSSHALADTTFGFSSTVPRSKNAYASVHSRT